jgi:hypothetical protein
VANKWFTTDVVFADWKPADENVFKWDIEARNGKAAALKALFLVVGIDRPLHMIHIGRPKIKPDVKLRQIMAAKRNRRRLPFER